MAKIKMTKLDLVAGWLIVIGALNWGLVSIGFNLVEWLANLINFALLETIVYAIVGLSALYFAVRIAIKFK